MDNPFEQQARAKDAEIERLKAELSKYQQSNKDHWDHLADIAKDLRYDHQVREGHLDVIRDQRAEIERLKRAFDIIADKLVIADERIRFDHENALEADELLAAKDAEIEGLNKSLEERAREATK
jgi:putative hemolysin